MLNAILNFIIKECYHERKSQFITLLHNMFFIIICYRYQHQNEEKVQNLLSAIFGSLHLMATLYPSRNPCERQHSNSKIIHNLVLQSATWSICCVRVRPHNAIVMRFGSAAYSPSELAQKMAEGGTKYTRSLFHFF